MIDKIRRLIDGGKSQEAVTLLDAYMVRHPEDAAGMRAAARLLLDLNKNAMARTVAYAATTAELQDPEGWLLLAVAEAQLQRPDETIAALHKAEQLGAPQDVVWRYLAVAHVTRYDFEKAEYYANKCIAVAPHEAAYFARSYARLHRRDWGRGWDDYHHGLGKAQGRDRQEYGLPEWRGEPGSVLVYAEQGLGDQIAFCSALGPEVTQIVTHPKIEKLIRRTFPGKDVHGTQFKPADFVIAADSQINMAGHMRFSRRKADDFTGRPYLVPCPDRSRMCDALLGTEKPRLGIAWTGGTDTSHGGLSRNKELADLLPILSQDFEVVSLEYRPRSDEIAAFSAEHGIAIKDVPFLTCSNDLDDVAALVNALDAVVCVPTTAYHVAGALGIPAYVLVHDRPHFHEGLRDKVSPWWECVRFYRGADSINEVARELRNHYSGWTWAQREAYRSRQFSGNGGAVFARAF